MSDESTMALLWKRLGIADEVEAIREAWPDLKKLGARRVATVALRALLTPEKTK